MEALDQAVTVLKFGGTSVGSGERIRKVVQIVANTLKQPGEAFPVVVVSAMSGVTDQLLRIARFACSGEHRACKDELQALWQKHFEAVEKAVRNAESRARLRGELEVALTRLEQDVAALRQAAVQGQDVMLPTAAVASWGERLSVLLVAAAARDVGLRAEAVRQEVIITSHPRSDSSQPFGVVVGAEPLPDETRANALALIGPLVEQRIVPIACG